MRDADGKVLAVGDRVATTITGYHYGLAIGVVDSFTPKKVRVRIVKGPELGITIKDPEQLAITRRANEPPHAIKD